MTQRPYAEAADQNKEVISELIRECFSKPGDVLEIGAGTGQHARYFCQCFPHLRWLPSEHPDQFVLLQQGVYDTGLANLLAPIEFDVGQSQQAISCDYAYTANTMHIMSWKQVCCMLDHIGTLLQPGGVFLSYGPYNTNGQYTSESNKRFDQMLRQRDPLSGVRDVQDLQDEASGHRLILAKVVDMPVNNKILVWHKSSEQQAV